jgi:hypothetical protein
VGKHPYRWYGKQYHYLPTGKLSFRILDALSGSRCQWRDGKRQRLENCPGRVIQALTTMAQIRKAQRAEREARKRAWAEAQRRREELRREIEAEGKRVVALTAEAGIEPTVGSIGDSYDNALAETINGLYKTELIHRRSWKSREAVELATLGWVDWFTHRRPLEPIGSIPPAEAEAADYRQLSESAKAA